MMRPIILTLVSAVLFSCSRPVPAPQKPDAAKLAAQVLAGVVEVRIYDFCTSCPHMYRFFGSEGTFVRWEQKDGNVPQLNSLSPYLKSQVEKGGVIFEVRSTAGEKVYRGWRVGGFTVGFHVSSNLSLEDFRQVLSLQLEQLNPEDPPPDRFLGVY